MDATTADYLAGLTAEQRQAVLHGTSGQDPAPALLVIAGAGSGKTDTLAHRVAHLMVQRVPPERILLLTFSRRAAAEMVRRAERICARVLGLSGPSRALRLGWAGTFHGIGARLLRAHATSLGLDPSFTILDREDAADLMNLVRHEQGLSQAARRFPAKATCLAIYSRCVNAEAPLDVVLAEYFPWCSGWENELRTLFGAYVAAKQRQNTLDYDDLLLYWAAAMTEPGLADAIGSRFDQVLVDEYQDTNRLQASILHALKPGGSGLTVVGDDAQSIYGFRAATVRNILDFPARCTPAAAVVTLAQNYRSSQPILAAANGVIDLAAERFTKNLWTQRRGGVPPRLVTVPDEADQAGYIATEVLENRERGIPLRQQAVLFRTAHHSGALEVELTRRDIPFVKFGGLKFLDSAHVKDLLALLRFVENPKDRMAGLRVFLLLPGIGPAAAERLLARLAASERLADLPAPARAGAAWAEFVATVQELRHAGWPAALDQARQWYAPHLERIHEDAAARAADLAQLAQIAAGYPSRERFLTELTLHPPDAVSDQAGVPMLDEDYLILSTIHSAKGQEWQAVFVLNVVDGCIPSDLGTGSRDEIEEERRLLYVAMTRARDELHLLVPQRFFTHGQNARGDRHVHAGRSRFLPDELLPLFEQAVWPKVVAEPAAVEQPAARADLAARIRSMWVAG